MNIKNKVYFVSMHSIKNEIVSTNTLQFIEWKNLANDSQGE